MHDDDDDNGDSIIKRVFFKRVREEVSLGIFFTLISVFLFASLFLSRKKEKRKEENEYR